LLSAGSRVNPSSISRHLGGGDKKRIARILSDVELPVTTMQIADDELELKRRASSLAKGIALAAEHQIREKLLEVFHVVDNAAEKEIEKARAIAEKGTAVAEAKVSLLTDQLESLKTERQKAQVNTTHTKQALARAEKKLAHTTSLLLVAKESERRLEDTKEERDRFYKLLTIANEEKSALGQKISRLEKRLKKPSGQD